MGDINKAETGILKSITETANKALSQQVKTVANIFPIDVFPKQIQEFALSAKENLKFSEDYVLSSVISAVGLSIGNTHALHVKGVWVEKSNFYFAIVGRAGDFKTHSVNLAYLPITQFEKIQYCIYQEKIKEWKKELQAWKDNVNKNGAQEPEKPIYKRKTVDDYTPEGLIEVLKNNPTICVNVDELNGWLGSFGRYNKSGEESFWLKSYNSKPISVIRKTSENTIVNEPHLSVIGGIQPAILTELGKGGRDKSGFTDRILFAYPDELPENIWTENDIPHNILSEYINIINRILELPEKLDRFGNSEPYLLQMSNDAKALWENWYNENAQQKYEISDSNIDGVYAKLVNYTLRFSLVLQMLKYACNIEDKAQITKDTMQGAIRLAEYYKNTATRASAAMIKGEGLSSEPLSFQKLYHALPDTFKAAEAKEIAIAMNYKIRNLERAYNNKKYFSKLERGLYKKVIEA